MCAAGEEFFRGRRPLRVGAVDRKLPALGEIGENSGGPAHRQKILVLLVGRSQRSQSWIGVIDMDTLMFHARAKLEANLAVEFQLFEKERGDLSRFSRLQKRLVPEHGKFLVKKLGADRAFQQTDRFVE